MLINYYDFAIEYALLQRDRPEGVGLAKTLLIKSLVLMRVGISENIRLWNVPLKTLKIILEGIEKYRYIQP